MEEPMYKKDDIVKCRVTGIKNYGIFVKIDSEYDGLIHISQISESYVKKVEDYAAINDYIYAKITDIDEKNKQLKLSIKNLNYKVDGQNMKQIAEDGFLPLKNKLNIWVNEKLKDIDKT